MNYKPIQKTKPRQRVIPYGLSIYANDIVKEAGISLANLVGYWPMEESASPLQSKYFDTLINWNLSSTGGLVTYGVPGKIGKGVALNQDGNGGLRRTLLPIFARIGGVNFTIFGWVKITTKGAFKQIICIHTGGIFANNFWNFTMYWDNALDRFVWGVGDNTTNGNVSTVIANTFGAPSLDTWCFVVGRYNDLTKQISIQVNNSNLDVAISNFTPINSGNAFSIGASFIDGNAFSLIGVVDEFGWYNRELSLLESKLLYNNGVGVSL